jgi:hypothetical protein
MPCEAILEKVALSCRTGSRSAEVAGRWAERFRSVSAGAVDEPFISQRDAARTSLVDVLGSAGSAPDIDELLADQFRFSRSPQMLPDAPLSCRAGSALLFHVEHRSRRSRSGRAWSPLSFTNIVTSEDVRAYKPRGEPFEAVLRLLGA